MCKRVHYISYRIAGNFQGVINSLFPPPYENSLPERMHAVQGNKVILKITVFNLSMNAILGFLPHEYYPCTIFLTSNKQVLSVIIIPCIIIGLLFESLQSGKYMILIPTGPAFPIINHIAYIVIICAFSGAYCICSLS